MAALAFSASGCPDEPTTTPTNDVPSDTPPADVEGDATPDAPPGDTAPDAPDVGPDGGPDGGGPSNGTITGVNALGSGMDLPFDSTPSPDGTEVFYLSAVDEVHHLFKVSVANPGTPVQLSQDPGFVMPMGVVTDGSDVFVLDTNWEEEDEDGNVVVEGGAIFRVPVAGGAQTIVSGTEGTHPTGGTMSVDDATLYFTGEDPATEAPAVMSIPAAGGALTVIASGAPLTSPSGVAAASDGTVYVSDATAFDGGGGVHRVSGGSVTTLIDGIVLGQPGGIVISPDETHLIISAVTNLAETTVVYRVEIASSLIVDEYTPDSISANRESAGLHCARTAPVCSWANAGSGGEGGQVYMVDLEVAP